MKGLAIQPKIREKKQSNAVGKGRPASRKFL